MADVLRKLLDGGKLSDENCRLVLRGLGKQVDELHLSKNKAVDEWSSDEEEEVDEEYCRQVKESLGFDIDMNVRIPEWGIAPYELGDYEPPIDISLYGRLGVHCFNFEKGRNLLVMRIPKYNIELVQTRAYYITMEVEDLADNSSVHIFQTLVTRCFPRNNASLVVFTGICRLKPEIPGEGDADARLDEKAIYEFYKGSMPDFLSETKLDDKLRFYEVQEQDICENDWLRLYTEFALFCFWWFNEDGFKFSLPVEMKKIIVETRETDGEPCHKLKSGNAIFYINFRAKSRDYRSVVRRTTDGKTGHIILEINCWDDQPSPALTANATK
ncbi:unnamed protein product [Arabidopsis lyrata]|uniref:Predicted protein n=1 Tax=Arabidopsis lyrata subsp. lyrata TaxID=81972 RepID=D7LNG8_ARALL|nr:UPF0725 protein At3g44770 [Arabidopsis lyrata subsp. lyrata]EFH51951.1 predicted protein [Arabidopsis lyrata subsp. lyrata]CAH8267437.1 unnamed protein product [Arabidopsis lyrata]|eukprot:XP_002875692.1 UPF0725 protein At3g44770 [Arabidopsis lyrata subsp. lyrata]